MLRVENFSSPGKFKDISFSLKAGEILGLAGLVGAGRTEIAQALFGLDNMASGRVTVAGKQVRIDSPSKAIKLGLGLVPEDRKRHGLVLSMSACSNMTLPILHRLSRFGWIRNRAERSLADTFFQRMKVRAPGVDALIAGLSGGNQQKVSLAKSIDTHPEVLIVDEPTRGVDVGAKEDMYELLRAFSATGGSVIIASSEISEALMCDRVLVLKNGRVVAELDHDEIDRAQLGAPARQQPLEGVEHLVVERLRPARGRRVLGGDERATQPAPVPVPPSHAWQPTVAGPTRSRSRSTGPAGGGCPCLRAIVSTGRGTRPVRHALARRSRAAGAAKAARGNARRPP